MFAIVYQCGVANVFEVGGDQPVRLLQSTFFGCECFCRGIIVAGGTVRVYHADIAGNLRLIDWADGPGEMFADKKHPPA